jgi:hypothetical protein
VDHGLVKKKGYFREIDLGYFYEVFFIVLWLAFFCGEVEENRSF